MYYFKIMKDSTFSASRRSFIKKTASSLIAAPFIFRYPFDGSSSNGRLNHACIGVGGMMGMNDLQNFKKHPNVQIVAICDVDSDNLKKAS